MELIFFVGIPASGKSTLANQYREQGYQVLSSDEIRSRITGGTPLESYSDRERRQILTQVFETVHRLCAEALTQGKSVVVDATNLSRKRRMHFLQQVQQFACTRICLLFITPVELCLARNRARSGYSRVPDADIYRLACSFECPVPGEGWDEIRPVIWQESYRFPCEAMEGFPQDNPHHTLTLDAHMASAADFCRSHGFGPMLERVAQYHDIGKFYTKRFENYRGEPTQDAHYYGHESYGALLYLAQMCCGREPSGEEFRQILYEAALIGSHMRPLTRWKQNPRSRDQDITLFGEAFVADLEKLHQADRAAH